MLAGSLANPPMVICSPDVKRSIGIAIGVVALIVAALLWRRSGREPSKPPTAEASRSRPVTALTSQAPPPSIGGSSLVSDRERR